MGKERFLKIETLGSNPDTPPLKPIMFLCKSLYFAVLEFPQTIDIEIVGEMKEMGERENQCEVLRIYRKVEQTYYCKIFLNFLL